MASAGTTSRKLGEKLATTKAIEDRGFNMAGIWRMLQPEPLLAVDRTAEVAVQHAVAQGEQSLRVICL